MNKSKRIMNFTQEFLLQLYYVKKLWHRLSYWEKNRVRYYLEEELFTIYALPSRPTARGVVFENFLFTLIGDFCNSDRLCQDNLLNVLSGGRLWEKLISIGDYQTDSSRDALLQRFLDILKTMDHRKYLDISCFIYPLCSPLLQNKLHYILELKHNKAKLSYSAAARGIFCGAINYDINIRRLFLQKLSLMPSAEEADTENPVFSLFYLYIYGFINMKELLEYSDFCCKSSLLCRLLVDAPSPSECYKNLYPAYSAKSFSIY